MLSIGQFSKTCLVTVKTLRHYEKVGLLRPRFIDPDTGYRFYGEEQLPDMLLIQRLKRYGFSLKEITRFLSLTDPKARFYQLENQKYRLQHQICQLREVLSELENHLRHLERSDNIMGYQNAYAISLEEISPQPTLCSRQVMGVADFGQYFGALQETICKNHIQPVGYSFAVYHDREFDPKASDIELGFILSSEKHSNGQLPGGLCAVTTHVGGYSGLPEAYAAVTAWIGENGYSIAAPPYEIYVKTQFDHIPAEEWETKIYFPITK